MVFMSPSLGLIAIPLGIFAILLIWFIWKNLSPDETKAWPMTEATIQSVGTVVVHARRNTYSVEVGDFSYSVNGEYYSGRLTIAPSAQDRSPRGLVHQKIQVHYDSQKPERFSVPHTEIDGFLLGPYNVGLGEDIDPIDLNIDTV